MKIDLKPADPTLSKQQNVRRAARFHERRADECEGERANEHERRAAKLNARLRS